jgi:hypothetical protein
MEEVKQDAQPKFDVIGAIINWANDRNIIKGATPQVQYLKLVSEIGEFYGAMAINELVEIEDGIGDAVVVLTIIAVQCGLDAGQLFAERRKFYRGGNVPLYSLVQSIGLLGDALAKGNMKNVERNVGYAYGVLGVFAGQLAVGLEACAQAAYEQIKDRKGIMYEGVFVRSTDPDYANVVAKLKAQEA